VGKLETLKRLSSHYQEMLDSRVCSGSHSQGQSEELRDEE
jgi:hypothetical protein